MDDIKEYKVIHLMYSYFDYNAVIILVSVTSIYSIKLDFSKEKKKRKGDKTKSICRVLEQHFLCSVPDWYTEKAKKLCSH